MQLTSERIFERALRHAVCMLVLALGIVSSHGFSLLGPIDSEEYQDPEIAYELIGDIGTPKNIGEEYRWNIPVWFYAFDQNFLDYFGTNGVREVEKAIEIYNNLTNTGFSALDPNQFPLESVRINPRAEQLMLLDLKTVTMHLLLEEMGLTEPERYVWTLRDRYVQPGLSCPFMVYHVIMRNFDPFTYSPSPYINNVLFGYEIIEFCNGTPQAYTFNFPVDFPPDIFSPESTTIAYSGTVFRHGAYALSLTRDDAGGLRYLYRTNNINWEPTPTGAQQFVTNRSQAQLVFSSNLWSFAAAALTNTAAQLQTLYPGLVIAGTTNIYTNIYVTNYTAYFTNSPWRPVDSFPILYIQTNRTLTVQTHYIHTFGNVFTVLEDEDGGFHLTQVVNNQMLPRGLRGWVETISVTNSPWLPVDSSFVTNVSLRAVTTRGVPGDFFILPTNACSLEILGLQATLINRITNTVLTATNQFFGTNAPGGGTGTNVNQTPFFAQNLITLESNRVWLVYPVECSTSNETLVAGVDRIQFIRTSFDSLIGRYYQPITNIYTFRELTNSIYVTNVVRRIITQPDILFSSVDLNNSAVVRTVPNWRTNGTLNGLAGPGTMDPPIEIGFNRVGPLIVHFYGGTNVASGGLAQAFGTTNFIWGSYDGSANEPIMYPFGTHDDIEQILLFQILSSELPEGSVGVPYSTQLQATGGQAPYTWTPHVDSPPLPPGLSLSNSGVISGTPEEEGEYSFSVTVTEAGGRSTTRTLTIYINP